MSAAERVQIRRRILSCGRCHLATQCTRPVPWHGPAPNPLLVIGEAPGRTEDQEGRPFVGRAGQLLRRLMGEVGIDPDALAWANTVACFPHRTPTGEEIQACSANLLDTLRVVAPVHVLLVGGVALSVWRSDVRITHVRGKAFSPTGYWWAFPILHPAAALRDPSLVAAIRKDLAAWKGLIDGPGHRMASEECARCGAEVERYDPDGLGWCARHVAVGMPGWEKAEAARRKLGQPAALQAAMGV